MKSAVYLISLFSAVALLSCSKSLSVYSDFDSGAHVDNYHTFGWAPVSNGESSNPPLYVNELNDKRIKKFVSSELQSRGYVYSSEKPELLIHYHIIVDSKTGVSSIPNPYYYGPYRYYQPYWGYSQVNVYNYKERTLIIDLIDASNNDLVWRAWVSPFLEDNPADKTELEIREAVMMIFTKFPYRAKEQNQDKPK